MDQYPVFALESLGNTFFELSNEDRLRILYVMDKKAANLTGLSKELDLSIQECGRHLSRLVRTKLAEKDAQGFYHLTLYGKTTLKQLDGLRYTSQNREYFVSHSIVDLPTEFVARIGDLVDSQYVGSVMAAFYNVDRVFSEAEEFICVITDQYHDGWYPLTTKALERGVRVRHIETKYWVVPPIIKRGYRTEDLEAADRARIKGLLEERVLDELKVCMYTSEKEIGAVAFPMLDSRFDYLGFTAKDERAHKWCQDLFQYYWERAHNRTKLAEELFNWVTQRPKATHAFRKIAAGESIEEGEEFISQFEGLGLLKQGQLTKLGDIVYTRLMR